MCISKPSLKNILCDQKSGFEGSAACVSVWFLVELDGYASLPTLEFYQSFNIGQAAVSTSDMIKDPP